MKKIYCDHCGKFLFESEKEGDSRARIAAEAERKGFVMKLPLIYDIHCDGFKIFCSNECWKTWFNGHVSPEQKEKGDKIFEDIKKEMTSPEFINGLTDGLNKIQETFKKIKK